MSRLVRVRRRVFLKDVGKGAAAAVVWTAILPACADDGNEGDGAESTVGAGGQATSTGTTSPATTATSAATMTSAATTTATSTAASATSTANGGAAFEWERVSLGFVSAYVLARNGEAVVVDTGVEGSAAQIESGLGGLGLDWGAVGHVVVTHAHPDHMGSLAEVLALAPDAMAYAGAADIPAMTAPRDISAVGDGDLVFDLEIIETPGHTPGHISVLDLGGRVLLVGDALVGEDGGIAGPPPEFTAAMALANESVTKLAEFDFETILFGHGEPVLSGGKDLVRDFANSL